MADNITLTTQDSEYTYTGNNGNVEKSQSSKFRLVNDVKTANTQGYQIKKQVGRDRIEAMVEFTDLTTNLRTNLYPMLNYPVTLDVVFDRIPPMRTSTNGIYEMVDFTIMQEFDNGEACEVSIKLIEVIGV